MVLGSALAMTGIADLLSMLFDEYANSRGAGGTLLAVSLIAGGFLLLYSIPRLVVAPWKRPFVVLHVTMLTLLLLGLLTIPVVGTALLYPSGRTTFFAGAWVVVLTIMATGVLLLRCPSCRKPFFRRGLLHISLACAHCGAGTRKAVG